MIMRKVYIKPEFEIFEVEPAGVMLIGSLNMGGDDKGDRVNPDDDDWEDLSNKRNPWGSAPWE